MTERITNLVAGLTVLVLLLGAPRAEATLRFGPIQIAGNLQAQNIIRHPDADTFQLVQQRNVARVQFTYEWLQGGRWMDKFDIPFVRDSKVFLLWRGVYDSVYDFTPGFEPKRDIHGDAYAGRTLPEHLEFTGRNKNILKLESLSRTARDSLKFENVLREAYIDFRMRDVPLQVRAGRQQIVWGETDNFRMLDRANSLDLTWHFQQEIPAPAFGWDEIRRPFWMVKFLYEIGNVWKFSQSFIEWYWNLGDWEPAKQAFLPQPWGLPFLDPLTNPVDGAYIEGICSSSNVRNNRGQAVCNQLIGGTELFGRGDWDRNPIDNGQWGVRYHGIAPFGLEFTLNYFYQRFAGDDGTNYAPLRALPKNDQNIVRFQRLTSRGVFPAEAFNPYVHSIGASANYSDESYTQAVFRFETIFDMGIPFFDVAKESVVDLPALPAVTEKDMWKGMIGFDRPTWIRWLNKKSTVFLTGQFFWHYLVDNPDCNAQDVANFNSAGKRKVGSCLVGGLDLPSNPIRLGTANANQAGSVAFRDKIRDWEALITFAAFTFYRGGSIIPTLGLALDPVNSYSMEPFWAVDFVAKDWLVFNLSQRYFLTPRGGSRDIVETWGLGGLNRGRSETVLRVTFQY
jgi:hypothetical protein